MTEVLDIVCKIRCTVTSVRGVPLFLDNIINLYSGRKTLGSYTVLQPSAPSIYDQQKLVVTATRIALVLSGSCTGWNSRT